MTAYSRGAVSFLSTSSVKIAINWILIFMGWAIFFTSCELKADSQLPEQKLYNAWLDPKVATTDIVNSLSDREKIGQLMMFDFRYWKSDVGYDFYPVTKLPSEVINFIKEYAVGSVILFRENCIDSRQIYQLNKSIQLARSRIPLFIAVDQEGGLISRIDSITRFPGNMALAATRDLSLAEKFGALQGEELAALGFNMNFAPVVDVNSNDNNPVIGVRSYGSNVELTKSMSQSYIRGLQKSGIIATIKHFPGYGSVANDPHFELPVLSYSEELWQKNDLPPFKYAIGNGIKAIMTAHVVVPSLDNTTIKSTKTGKIIGTPATLSTKIIHDTLRNKFKYNGLIISDSFIMDAISNNFDLLYAIKKSILVGTDIIVMPVSICQPNDIKEVEDLYQKLERQMQTDPQFARCVDQAARRVVFTKLKEKISPNLIPIEKVIDTIGSQEHKNTQRIIAEKSITLIKNDNIIPFNFKKNIQILIISGSKSANDIVSDEIQKISSYSKKTNVNLNAVAINLEKENIFKNIEQKITQADCIVLITHNLKKESKYIEKIIDFSNENRKKLVVVSSGTPYDIAYLKTAKANIAIYGFTESSRITKVGFTKPVTTKEFLDYIIFSKDEITKTGAITRDMSDILCLETNLRAGIRSLFVDYEKNSSPAFFNQPSGKLPVDVKQPFGTNILYPYGHGLTYINKIPAH